MSNETVEKGLQTTRKEFSAVEVTAQTGDLASVAQAAHAKAQVEARYIMALQHPRNMVKVRQDLMAICSIPEFAQDKSTLYHVPRGRGSIEGLGIRFAEAAAECWTNILMEAPTVFEDETRRHIRMTTTDLEKNVTYMKDIVIKKTVERLFVPEGETFISSRINSEGKVTYTIPASEDALLTKEGAEISKGMRTQILRLIPVDLKNECEKKIREIRVNKITEDPAAALKAVVDGMAKQNVTVPMLEEFLEHPITQITPAEIANLQAVYGTLRDGLETWKSIMENAEEARKMTPKAKAGAEGEATKGVAGAEARVGQAAKGAAEATKPPPAPAKGAAAVKTAPAAKTVAPPPPTTQQTPPAKAAPPAQPPAATPAPAPPAATKAPETAETPATQPPTWTQEVAAPEATPAAAPPPPVETVPLVQEVTETTAPPAARKKSKNPIIRKIKLPEFIDRVGPDDTPSEEQIQAARTETDRLNVNLEKTVVDWTGAELSEINTETMLVLTEILTNYKPAGK